MKNKKERIELSYTPQITVDHDSGAKMSFDNGYFSGSNLRYLEMNGLDGNIPVASSGGDGGK
jgi:hypothetical protein